MQTQAKNEPKDIKPPVERKDDDWADRGKAFDASRGEDNGKIGSPDTFLEDAHKGAEFARVKVYQVWADGSKRGYVIHDATNDTSKIGYVELSEGMDKKQAEDVLLHAYDNTAALV